MSIIANSSTEGAFGFGTLLRGTKVTSKTCLANKNGNDYCLKDFEWVKTTYQQSSRFDIYFQAPVITYGGVLGLAPTSELTIELNDQYALNEDDPSFSFYLGKNDSFLEFGPVDTSLIKSSETENAIDEITYIPLLYGDKYWANEISGIKIDGGEYFDNITFAFEPYRAQTYTGGQCI